MCLEDSGFIVPGLGGARTRQPAVLEGWSSFGSLVGNELSITRSAV